MFLIIEKNTYMIFYNKHGSSGYVCFLNLFFFLSFKKKFKNQYFVRKVFLLCVFPPEILYPDKRIKLFNIVRRFSDEIYSSEIFNGVNKQEI